MEAQNVHPAVPAPADDPKSAALPALYRAIFYISLPFGILDFVLPIYGKRLGADAVQIGLFFSAFSLMIVILRPLVGAALDRYGRRPFFLAGLLGYALTMLTFAFSNSVALLVLARTIQGCASACLWLSAQAITADAAPAGDRGRLFGHVQQSNAQGAILGTFIGFSVLFTLSLDPGWKILFLAYTFTSLFSALYFGRQVVETNPHCSTGAANPLPGTRSWRLLLLVAAATGASYAMLSPVLMIFLQERFTAEINVLALAYLPSALVWAFLSSRLGALADRFGRKPLMLVGMAVAALTSLLFPALSSLATLAVFWAVQTLCLAAGDPAEQALVADLTGGDQRGRAYGVYTMAAGLGATVGPLAGGWLYQSISPAAPFYANGIILALSAVLLLLFLPSPARTTDTS